MGDALDEVDGATLPDELEPAYIAAALHVPELADAARVRGERLLAGLAAAPTPSQRHAIAHLALHHAVRGAARNRIREMATLAWGNGTVDHGDNEASAIWPLVTGALLFADELELGLSFSHTAAIHVDALQSTDAHAMASYCRVWALYEQGRIAEAAAAARAGVDAHPANETYFRTAYGALAACYIQRGELDQAEITLSIIDHLGDSEGAHLPFLLDTRAQLRLAQLRPEEALEDALEAGRRVGPASPGALAWRSTAALAHLSLGNGEAARELASEELELARELEVVRVVIRDLRVLGLSERGAAGLRRLREAVSVGEHYGQRLEYMHALLDLGGALRRANHRAAAREPLRKALELSHRGGADQLEKQARSELTAAGGRPRREMLSGVESLTPSEHRVGELASRGLTTRQIAESLYITPKTVEFHLRNIYQKLDVSSRGELADAIHERAADRPAEP
jgi:ATP/maltotriose-dependent transcriptional regulator MalT